MHSKWRGLAAGGVLALATVAVACSGAAVVDGSGAAGTTTAAGGTSGTGGTGGVAGGLASDPGQVDCGGTVCQTPSQYCCVEDPGSREIWECMDHADDTHCGAWLRECDEAADCEPGYQCCVPMTARPFPVYSTHCALECDSFYWFQVCKTDAECPDGADCVLQLCHGEPLQTCGGLDDPHGYCG